MLRSINFVIKVSLLCSSPVKKDSNIYLVSRYIVTQRKPLWSALRTPDKRYWILLKNIDFYNPMLPSIKSLINYTISIYIIFFKIILLDDVIVGHKASVLDFQRPGYFNPVGRVLWHCQSCWAASALPEPSWLPAPGLLSCPSSLMILAAVIFRGCHLAHAPPK